MPHPEDISVRTVELAGADGLTLIADEAGDPNAATVMLLHGGGQTRHAWGTTLRVLGSHRHALSVDLRGHGDSSWAPDGDYTRNAYARDVHALASVLPSPPVLVGASLGGIASLIAIADHPGLARALVLVDVAPRLERGGLQRIGEFMTGHLDGFASLEEVADAIHEYNPHRPRPTDLSGLAKILRQRADGRWVWHWDPRFVSGKFGSPDETRSTELARGTQLTDAARSLTIPTLLVRGRMSDLLSEQGAQELLELVPHAKLADVAGAGHMVAGDRNDLFNDAIMGFLDEL